MRNCREGKVEEPPVVIRDHEHPKPDGSAVPVLDALVRNSIESNLDPDIARSVIAREPKMREDVARIAQRLVQ